MLPTEIKEGIRLVSNPHRFTGECPDFLSREATEPVRHFHESLEQYAPTPLVSLPNLVALPLCLRLGVPYRKLQEGMVQSCSRAIVPIMILLINGGLVGTWIAAGTVPIIINLGIKLISPRIFLMNAVVAASYLSVTPAQLIPFTFFAYVTPVVLVIVTLFGSDTKYVADEQTGKGE